MSLFGQNIKLSLPFSKHTQHHLIQVILGSPWIGAAPLRTQLIHRTQLIQPLSIMSFVGLAGVTLTYDNFGNRPLTQLTGDGKWGRTRGGLKGVVLR